MNVPGSMKGCLYTHKIILGSSSSGFHSTHLLNTSAEYQVCTPQKSPSAVVGTAVPHPFWMSAVPPSEKPQSLRTKQGGTVPWAGPTEDKKGHLCPQKTKTPAGSSAKGQTQRGQKWAMSSTLSPPPLPPPKTCSIMFQWEVSHRGRNSSSGSSAPLCMAIFIKKCFNAIKQTKPKICLVFSISWLKSKTLWIWDLPNTGLSLSKFFFCHTT